MHHPALETIAERLTEQLRCEQEDLCRPIVQQVTRGKPVTPASLRASLQVSQDELEQRLARLPTEVEFDTVLLPPQLDIEAQVQSTCPVTGQLITFVATPEGVIRDLSPASGVMSLVVPAQRSDCTRATFCQQSLLFQSERAASAFLADHPEALLLSVEDAAYVGRLVARTCSLDAT